MTMSELAKLANVSVSTVSKAFYEADDVSKETKQHIFEIAKEYGCYGKFYKGKYHKKIVAVIYPELESGYYTSYVEKLEKILEKNNCVTVMSVYNFESAKQAEQVEYYASYMKVDGIIVLGLKNKLKKGFDVPIVSVFLNADPFVDAVLTDYMEAYSEAILRLKEYGHRKIAFIGENLTGEKSEQFQKIVKQAEMEMTFLYTSPYRFEKAGEDGVRKILEGQCDCTAIVCAYDNIAYGAMKELQKQGYQVPEDFSVIGIDNLQFSNYTETTLSSIGTNADEVCITAWELLSKKMENPYLYSNRHIVMQGKFVERDSVGKAKG